VIDASATNTTASYLQTPQGLYQITARTSDTVVTITTPSGYTNESAVAGTVWKKLFGITTPEITSISPNYTDFGVITTQPSTVVTTATKMGILGFVTSDATRTISLTYNGEDRNTHVNTPLANLHNDLAGLQGGAATEYFHSTSAEYAGTGTGVFVRATSPALVTPDLGTPSALVGTNITGTATAFTASNVTTNANLTGEATSVGNAATLTNSAVIGKVLTGYTSGAGTVAATDTILQAIQKLNGNAAGATGTVTSVSVVSNNGFAGTVATATTTPAITLTTTVTGMLKGSNVSGIVSAGTSGTDYSLGTSALATGILKSTTTTGALTIAIAADFPTLNQNTSGNAATATTATNTNALNIVGYGSSNGTYYQTSGTFAGYSGWAGYWVSNHGDGATYYNQTIIMPFWGPPKYSRLEGGVQSGPHTFITTENYTSYSPIPAGTAMVFKQTAAPTGWTKVLTNDNSALRVVTGAASTGGSVAFTTAFSSQAVTGTNGASGAYTLATADIPSHSHLYQNDSGASFNANFINANRGNGNNAYNPTTKTSGGGGSHSHSAAGFTGTAIYLAVAYVDVIIATKD
jgi:hypothetical protein